MHLNRFSDYSLRTLFLVAANPDRLIRLSDLVEYYGIPIGHLRKIVHNLSRLGYLRTHRGKNGGMELAMPATEINIGKLIAQTEGRPPLIDCSDCALTPVCRLTGALREAEATFYESLGKYTLADLLDEPRMIQRLELPTT